MIGCEVLGLNRKAITGGDGWQQLCTPKQHHATTVLPPDPQSLTRTLHYAFEREKRLVLCFKWKIAKNTPCLHEIDPRLPITNNNFARSSQDVPIYIYI